MIAVDQKSLRREWYEDEGELRVLLKTPADTPLTRRRLVETSAAVTAALSPANPVVAEQWLRTSDGWSGVLTCAFTSTTLETGGRSWRSLSVTTSKGCSRRRHGGGCRGAAMPETT